MQLDMFPPTSNWVAPQSLPDLRGEAIVAIDTETKDNGLKSGLGPGWVWHLGHVCGVSVAWGKENQIYLPVNHKETTCFDKNTVKAWLRETFRQEETRFVFHNADYDLGWLTSEYGCPIPAKIEDTAAMAAIVDENRYSYKLDDLCKDYGIKGKDETLLREACAVYMLKNPKEEMWKLPAKYVGPYAEQDARATLELFYVLKEKIIDENHYHRKTIR